MAFQFYNRYIPPSIDRQDDLVRDRPAKKRRKNGPPKKHQHIGIAHKVTEDDHPEAAVIPDEQVSVLEGALSHVNLTSPAENDKPRNPKADIRTDARRPVGDRRSSNDPLAINKHHSILSKYASALKPPFSRSDSHVPQKGEHDALNQDKQLIESYGLDPLPQPSQIKESPKVSANAALPDWLRNPTLVSSTDSVSFADLPLSKCVIDSLEQKGYKEAFAVQTAVIPMLLPGPAEHSDDVCISAATGSGKTLAYALPMVEALQGRYGHRLTGLVLVPTRELLSQAKEVLELCAVGTKLKIGTAVGSKSLKEEQDTLITKYQNYDPEAYKAEQEKLNDEDEALMNWDFDAMMQCQDEFPPRRNFVVDYRSKVDILISTPGRLVEHVKNTRGFTLEHVRWLVIDEADRLLEKSFQQWVEVVLPELEYMPNLSPLEQKLDICSPFPRRREMRKIVLSATMTKDVGKLAALRLRRPKLVILESKMAMDNVGIMLDETHETVELPSTLQEAALTITDVADKPLYLIKFLESVASLQHPSSICQSLSNDPRSSKAEKRYTSTERSSSSSDSDDDSKKSVNTTISTSSPKSTRVVSTHGTLIFTNNNENAQRLARLLAILKPALTAKIGTLVKSAASATSRKTLKDFRSCKLSIILASDRASRGLDIPELSHVINYDMPKSLTSYVHRVGRTARAEKDGLATTFVAHHEARWFWNEIARSKRLTRAPGRKVQRLNFTLDVSKEEEDQYREALAVLGVEAQGHVSEKDGTQRR